jgi:hypothetical protein
MIYAKASKLRSRLRALKQGAIPARASRLRALKLDAIRAKASESGHLKRSFSGPQVASVQYCEAGCERSNLTQYAPKRARAGT